MKKTQNILLILLLSFITMTLSCSKPKDTKIDTGVSAKVKKTLIEKYGEPARFRIERGVEQTAALWRESDGNAEQFAAFCTENFAGDSASLTALFKRAEYYNEILSGYFTEMTLGLRQYLDLDWGPVSPIDQKMGGFDPSAHLTEDLYQNKYAFLVTLNFPRYTLEEKVKNAAQWNRLQWAYARLGSRFITRIPAELNQKLTATFTDADSYISEYNIFMGTLTDDAFKQYFPAEMKLITHWGLRDELKAHYTNAPDELPKQKIIYEVMKRIILQEIPGKAINAADVQWNPYTNKLYKAGKEISSPPEPDTRYQKLLNVFNAIKATDPYYTDLNTHVLRSFEAEREVSEKEVEKTFDELLTAPQTKQVAALIKKRLGRDLLPFDLWYTGFKSRGSINEAELDKITKAKYPTPEAFEKDIENILVKLGFPAEDAKFIAEKIQVDPARGSGHAYGTQLRKFKSHLRTRVMPDGMNYKGYNIAVHELGHNVEQTLTLYKTDYYSLNGVPNTAFTEAFAFLFQRRDLELLGMKNEDAFAKDLGVIDNFWSSYEIMGVSLVDMKIWNWMYKNPNAKPAELKQAVISIAKEVWNKYYADVFGIKDELILAVYSHIIDAALYLPNYALGHLIEFQIEDYLKDKNVGPEMMRMCASGNIIPQQWMKNAVGTEISVKPMLKSVDEALTRVK